jgi:tRNA splicing endonuclease
MRLEGKTAYGDSKGELERNLEGIKLAQKILSEYYATEGKGHNADEGSAGGIIGLLETIEADMSKRLAEMNADEDMAVADYEQLTKENNIEKTLKDQDLKYKAKESVYLDKTSAELVADRTGVQAELDAVQEYLARIEEQCIAKAEVYSDRKSRREAEIAGLKQALEILESETALVQQEASRRTLRGAKLLRAGALQASA